MKTKRKKAFYAPLLIFPTIPFVFFKTVVAHFHSAGTLTEMTSEYLQEMALFALGHAFVFLPSGIARKISIAMQKEKRGWRKRAKKTHPFLREQVFLFCVSLFPSMHAFLFDLFSHAPFPVVFVTQTDMHSCCRLHFSLSRRVLFTFFSVTAGICCTTQNSQDSRKLDTPLLARNHPDSAPFLL